MFRKRCIRARKECLSKLNVVLLFKDVGGMQGHFLATREKIEMEAFTRDQPDADAVFNGLEGQPHVVLPRACCTESIASLAHDVEKMWWEQDA